MIFGHFLLDINEANAFIVGCEDMGEAILIDAGEYDAAIPAFLKEHSLRLAKVFITHNHYDHTAGLPDITRDHGAEVIAGVSTVEGITARRAGHGDTISVGNLRGKVVATPGHTPEGLSLVFPGHIFSGDALFAGSIGGTASDDLRKQEVDHIRENLFSLPPHYEIHVGHGPSTTVGIESRSNPFFV